MPQAGATGVGQPVDAELPSAEPTQAPAQQPAPVVEPTRAARPTDKGRTAFDPAEAPIPSRPPR